MDNILNILNEMETPKGKTIMKKNADKCIQDVMKKKEKTKELLSNTNYFKWLLEFTKDIGYFYDNDWLYDEEKLNDEEKENIYNLHLFYNGIDKYAEENEIDQNFCKYGAYYNVRLNDHAFEIGFIIGQGTIFFCGRIPINPDKEYIDLNDVIAKTIEIKEDKTKKLVKKENT